MGSRENRKEDVMVDVNASRKANGVGEHDQIIHFVGGIKRLIQGVKFVWEQEMVHIVDYLGVEYIVNKNNVLFIEKFSYGGKGYDRDKVTTGSKKRPRRSGPSSASSYKLTSSRSEKQR